MAMTDNGGPPNSLEAIRACLEAKAAFVEIDITALADSDYLLVHEPYLEAETSGVGLVGECRAEDARSLTIKSRRKPTNFCVPLLSDVVALFAEYSDSETRLQLDFKNILPFPRAEPYQRLIDLIAPLGKRAIISTGADWQLRRLRALAPDLELGFDIGNNLDWRAPGELFDPRYPPWKCGAYGYWDDHPLAALRLWSTAEYLADRCELFMNCVRDLSIF